MKIILFYLTFIFCAINGNPLDKKIIEKEVLNGKHATLQCPSTDDNHNFFVWHLPDGDTVGPDNIYNKTKYDYEVLSGKLIIKHVTEDLQGVYECISMGIKSNDLLVRKVRMIVTKPWEEVWEHDRKVNYFRVVVVIGSVFLIIGGVYYIYRLITDRRRLPRYLEASDEEDSAEELFTAPGTSKPNEESNLFDKASTSGYEKLIPDVN